jgi:hypothetical protein
MRPLIQRILLERHLQKKEEQRVQLLSLIVRKKAEEGSADHGYHLPA